MKKIILLLIVFYSISLGRDTIDKEMFNMGKELYQDTCVSCHGGDGAAKTDMKLVVKPRDLKRTLLSEEQSYLIIKDGAHHWGAKADIMPAFSHVYNEEQLRSLAHYMFHKFNTDLEARIQKLCDECEPAPTDQDEKMKKWGKKIWKRNCSFCHGEKGYGDGIATKNPVDSIYPYNLSKTLLTKKQIFLYTKYGGKQFGTDKNDMPSWSKKYDDFKIRSVARYVDEVIKVKRD